MIILILLITVMTQNGKIDIDRDISERTRSWTVSNPQDAAILVYEHQQKAKEEGERLVCKLYSVDLSDLTVREERIPKLTFEQIGKIKVEASPFQDKKILQLIKDWEKKNQDPFDYKPSTLPKTVVGKNTSTLPTHRGHLWTTCGKHT